MHWGAPMSVLSKCERCQENFSAGQEHKEVMPILRVGDVLVTPGIVSPKSLLGWQKPVKSFFFFLCNWATFKFLRDDSHGSILLYRTMQPEYQCACYLSALNVLPYRSLLKQQQLDRQDRLDGFCRSAQQVEDEHHVGLIALRIAPHPIEMTLLNTKRSNILY